MFPTELTTSSAPPQPPPPLLDSLITFPFRGVPSPTLAGLCSSYREGEREGGGGGVQALRPNTGNRQPPQLCTCLPAGPDDLALGRRRPSPPAIICQNCSCFKIATILSAIPSPTPTSMPVNLRNWAPCLRQALLRCSPPSPLCLPPLLLQSARALAVRVGQLDSTATAAPRSDFTKKWQGGVGRPRLP